MSDNLWGSLDVDDIPDDPYFTGEGVYDAIVTRAETTQTREQKDKVVFEYTIDEYESDDQDDPNYSGNTVSEWMDYFPEMTKSDLAAMTPKERSKVLKKMSRVKNRIKHLDGDPDDENFTLKSLIDTEVTLGVRIGEDDEGNKYSNVKFVRAKSLDE